MFLSTIQLVHLDFSQTTLFTILTFSERILSVCFLQLKEYVSMFYYDGNMFLTINFKHFDFIE